MKPAIESKKVKRPGYVEIDPGEWWQLECAPQPRFDTVEIKYDGIWGRVDIDENRAEIYSRHGQLKTALDIEPVGKTATLHAEYMYGSSWSGRMNLEGVLFVFDCTSIGGHDISHLPLSRRREAAALMVKKLGEPFRMVKQFSISKTRELWEGYIIERNFEGLIFKESDAPFGAKWGRAKRVYEVDYVCLGFNQSDAPKYVGRMVASVRAGVYANGNLIDVASVSGLSEHQRTAMYNNPDDFIGRVFKASGYQVFKNGALRHPNFVDWHYDKLPQDCTLESVLEIGGWAG